MPLTTSCGPQTHAAHSGYTYRFPRRAKLVLELSTWVQSLALFQMLDTLPLMTRESVMKRGEEKLEKPEVVNDPKESASSGYIRAATHRNSQRL